MSWSRSVSAKGGTIAQEVAPRTIATLAIALTTMHPRPGADPYPDPGPDPHPNQLALPTMALALTLTHQVVLPTMA